MHTTHTPGPIELVRDPHTGAVDSIRVKEFVNNDLMGDYRGCIICDFTKSHGNREHAYEECEANAKHIFDCWNACEVICNPVKTVPKLLYQLKSAYTVIERLYEPPTKEAYKAKQNYLQAIEQTLAEAEGRE